MARASALLSRAANLESQWLDPASRYIDIAIQFVEVDRSGDGVSPTGRLSRVYGGRWDKHRIGPDGTPGCFSGDAERVHRVDCNPAQFGVLTDDETYHHLIIGSRRSSKTETLARWLLKQFVLWPKSVLSCLVQKHKKARKLAEEKLIPLLLHDWLGSGSLEINRGNKIPGYTRGDEVSLQLINRSRLDFLSGRVPDDARGDGVPAAAIDERQIIDPEAVGNLMLSVSEGGDKMQTLETGTALAGEFEEYVEQARANPRYRVTELSITDNVHLPVVDDPVTGVRLPAFVVSARSWMDQRRFEQEIGRFDAATGRFVPQFRSMGGTVYPDFDRSIHCQRWADRRAVMLRMFGPKAGKDITAEVTRHRVGKPCDAIVGLDWGIRPMCANVWRILQTPPGVPDLLWAIDEITIDDDGTPTKMGIAMKRSGLAPARTVVVADASDNRASSNYRLLRKLGYKVVTPSAEHRKNPVEKDRINAVNSKLLAASNDVTMLIDPDKCRLLARALQRHTYRENGKPEHDGYSHPNASAGYVAVRFFPAAADTEKVISGRHA